MSNGTIGQMAKAAGSFGLCAGMTILQKGGQSTKTQCMDHDHVGQRSAHLTTPGDRIAFSTQMRNWQRDAQNTANQVESGRRSQPKNLTTQDQERRKCMYMLLPPTVVTTGICPHWFTHAQCISVRKEGKTCPFFHPEFVKYDITEAQLCDHWSYLTGAPLTHCQVHWMPNVNRCRFEAKHPGQCEHGESCHKGHFPLEEMARRFYAAHPHGAGILFDVATGLLYQRNICANDPLLDHDINLDKRLPVPMTTDDKHTFTKWMEWKEFSRSKASTAQDVLDRWLILPDQEGSLVQAKRAMDNECEWPYRVVNRELQDELEEAVEWAKKRDGHSHCDGPYRRERSSSRPRSSSRRGHRSEHRVHFGGVEAKGIERDPDAQSEASEFSMITTGTGSEVIMPQPPVISTTPQATPAFGSIHETDEEEISDQEVDMSDSASGVAMIGEPFRAQTTLNSDFRERERPLPKVRPSPAGAPPHPPPEYERPLPRRPDEATVTTIVLDGQVMLGRLQRNRAIDEPMARQAYTLMVRVNDTDQLIEAEQEAMITLLKRQYKARLYPNEAMDNRLHVRRIKLTFEQALQPFRNNSLTTVMMDFEVTVARLVALNRLAKDIDPEVGAAIMRNVTGRVGIYASGQLIKHILTWNDPSEATWINSHHRPSRG